MKTQLASVTLLTAIFAGTATAGNVTIPNTFSSNTKAVAAEVNENFTAVKTAVDDNQAQIDALSTRVDESAIAVPGNTMGDMQYWDGADWVLIDAPIVANATLGFCGNKPSWSCIAIGDTGPGGGVVFYVAADGVSGLEAAPADIPGGPIIWGCNGFNTSTDTSIGSGSTNTSAIVSTCGGDAAVAAQNFNFGGKNDWFLPSKDELNELYLQKDVVGGFGTGHYWSSSEFDINNAWDQNFSDGAQFSDNGKNNANISVRAIRAF